MANSNHLHKIICPSHFVKIFMCVFSPKFIREFNSFFINYRRTFQKKERISFRNKPFKKLREKEKKKCMIGNVKEVNESGGL